MAPMSRLTDANVSLAKEIIGRYPRPEVGADPAAAPRPGAGRLRHRRGDGAHRRAPRHHAGRGLRHRRRSTRCSSSSRSAGTASTSAPDHLVHAARRRGSCSSTPSSASASRPAARPTDGLFTLEDVECSAACTEAPCLQVNYRYRYRVTPDDLDQLFDDLARRPPRRRDPAARHARPRAPAHPVRPWAIVGPWTTPKVGPRRVTRLDPGH